MTTTGRGLVVVARVELCLAGLALLAVQHDTTGFPRRARHHRTLRGFLGSIVADATRRVPRTLEVALQWQGRAQQAQIKCKSALNLFWSSGFKIGARKSRRAALGISPGELDFWASTDSTLNLPFKIVGASQLASRIPLLRRRRHVIHHGRCGHAAQRAAGLSGQSRPHHRVQSSCQSKGRNPAHRS